MCMHGVTLHSVTCHDVSLPPFYENNLGTATKGSRTFSPLFIFKSASIVLTFFSYGYLVSGSCCISELTVEIKHIMDVVRLLSEVSTVECR